MRTEILLQEFDLLIKDLGGNEYSDDVKIFRSYLKQRLEEDDKRISDYGWEESYRHAQATGGWQ